MKYMKSNIRYILSHMAILALPAMLLASCDYLDVAPEKRATLDDAIKTKADADDWVQSCYQPVRDYEPMNYYNIESSTDEFVNPQLWGRNSQLVSWNNIYPGFEGSATDNAWYDFYGYIGHAHLFLDQLAKSNPQGATSEDEAQWRAEIKFCKAWAHFRLMNLYGPIPIVDTLQSRNAASSDFPGRSHYDYCTDYVVRLLDEAAAVLPATYSMGQMYGRANATVCAALKSRVLLYDASPEWNGSFPYKTWKNDTYETPGYGKELVSHEYDRSKWERALQAALDAIRIAENQGGRKLMDLETANKIAESQGVPLPYVPGITEQYNTELNKSTEQQDTNLLNELRTFLERVRMLRYVSNSTETEGNKEILFITPDVGDRGQEAIPYRTYMQSNGQWWDGYSGDNPTFNILEHFYTANGVRPEDDPNYPSKADWLKSAQKYGQRVDREEIINFNVGREPRYYADFSYDGDDYGSLIRDGQPFRVNLRSSDAQGYDPNHANRNLCQTGFFTKKWIRPNLRLSGNSGGNFYTYYPRPILRLAELYLNAAECYCELGQTQECLRYLNVIRERAGVRDLTENDITDKMTLRDWVHNERTVEFYFEGQRYYDLRRWCEAPEVLSKPRRGLDSFRSGRYNPTFDQLNTEVVVDQPFAWSNRLYLMPIRPSELYSNPNLVQAPGY